MFLLIYSLFLSFSPFITKFLYFFFKACTSLYNSYIYCSCSSFFSFFYDRIICYSMGCLFLWLLLCDFLALELRSYIFSDLFLYFESLFLYIMRLFRLWFEKLRSDYKWLFYIFIILAVTIWWEIYGILGVNLDAGGLYWHSIQFTKRLASFRWISTHNVC